MLSLLGLEHELVAVNLRAGEHKTPEFRQTLNEFATVPVLTDGEVILRDSHAILVYLARQYGGETWLPSDPAAQAAIVQWLSSAASDIRWGPEAARLHHLFKSPTVNIDLAKQRSAEVLQVLNTHLADRKWLELERPTIADIACFPYVALATDGDISLEPYPYIQAWIDRIKQLPGFVGMPGL